MSELRQHWESTYQQKSFEQLGWYQNQPQGSIQMIGPKEEAQPLIDVGAGCSYLVDHLLAEGFEDVTLLDLSPTALDQVHHRLGAQRAQVKLIAADLLAQPLEPRYRCWHDRAVLHFLTDPKDQQVYAQQMKGALLKGGRLVIGGFAPQGPEKCSGLPVVRHSIESLQALWGPGFELVQQAQTLHTTPWGKEQLFLFTQWHRKG